MVPISVVGNVKVEAFILKLLLELLLLSRAAYYSSYCICSLYLFPTLHSLLSTIFSVIGSINMTSPQFYSFFAGFLQPLALFLVTAHLYHAYWLPSSVGFVLWVPQLTLCAFAVAGHDAVVNWVYLITVIQSQWTEVCLEDSLMIR